MFNTPINKWDFDVGAEVVGQISLVVMEIREYDFDERVGR